MLSKISRSHFHISRILPLKMKPITAISIVTGSTGVDAAIGFYGGNYDLMKPKLLSTVNNGDTLLENKIINLGEEINTLRKDIENIKLKTDKPESVIVPGLCGGAVLSIVAYYIFDAMSKLCPFGC